MAELKLVTKHFTGAGVKRVPGEVVNVIEWQYKKLLEEQRWIGTFDVDATGSATHRVAVPEDVGTIVAAAVTDEPVGGVPQPTGTIRLLGAVGGV